MEDQSPGHHLLKALSIPLTWGIPVFDPWVRKILWRRAWQLTPVFLPGESHGQRHLAGYSPWGHKELDMTEQLSSMQIMVSSFENLDWWYPTYESVLKVSLENVYSCFQMFLSHRNSCPMSFGKAQMGFTRQGIHLWWVDGQSPRYSFSLLVLPEHLAIGHVEESGSWVVLRAQPRTENHTSQWG